MENTFQAFKTASGSDPSGAALMGNWPWIVAAIALVVFFVNKWKGSRAQRLSYTTGLGADTGIATQLSDADLASYALDDTTPPVPAAPSANMDDFFSNAERRAEVQGEPSHTA